MRNHKLPDPYWFNVVLLSGYEALYQVDKNNKQLPFFFSMTQRESGERKKMEREKADEDFDRSGCNDGNVRETEKVEIIPFAVVIANFIEE